MTVNPLDYPALDGRVVTEAVARYCRDHGHAQYIVKNVQQEHCPRCGDVLTWFGEDEAAEAQHDMPLTDECGECGTELEFEQSVGWVDAVSGDDGGTYDYCPERRFAGHLPKRHELTCPAGTPGPGALPHG